MCSFGPMDVKRLSFSLSGSNLSSTNSFIKECAGLDLRTVVEAMQA